MTPQQQLKIDIQRAQRGATKGFGTQGFNFQQYQGSPQTMQPAVQPAQTQYRPQTGLIGAEAAIGQGFDGAMGEYNQHYSNAVRALGGSSGAPSAGGFNSIYNTPARRAFSASSDASRSAGAAGSQYIDDAIANFAPYQEKGGLAYDKVSALSGAMGSDAQQGAYDDFVESPGQAWLREQGERAVTRNAAATGNLGGGRVLQELQRQGQGLAAQDFDNYYNRLAGLGESGMAANNSVAGLSQAGAGNATSMANTAMSAGASMANAKTAAETSRTNALANTFMNWGNNTAGMAYGTGNTLAGLRTDAGNNIAQGNLGIGQAIGNGAYQAGTDASNILGGATNNISQILGGAAGANATGYGQLANGLAGVNGQIIGGLTGTNTVNNPTQTQGTLEGLGNAAGGLGALGSAATSAGGWGALLLSDKRLKKSIKKVGERSGVNIYSWEWTDEGARIAGDQSRIGVIAQEVPHATVMGDDGYLRVDYARVW